jgi:hypothetical protein
MSQRKNDLMLGGRDWIAKVKYNSKGELLEEELPKLPKKGYFRIK